MLESLLILFYNIFPYIKKLMKNTNALDYGLPSVFVVASPLQILCAYSTIRNLSIVDYSMFIIKVNNIRDKQTIAVADYFKLKYNVIDKKEEVYPLRKRLLAICSNRSNYHRAFVGSYCTTLHYFFAMRKISNNSVIVTIDDGNQSINVLKGDYNIYKSNSVLSILNNWFLNISSFIRHIRLRRDFYTIYSGIFSKDFNIGINNLCILSNKDHLVSKKIFIAGTAPNYIDYYTNLSYDKYLSFVLNFISSIVKEYPNEKVVFIPHGRDNEKQILNHCIKNNVEYVRPKECVELYFLNLDYKFH